MKFWLFIGEDNHMDWGPSSSMYEGDSVENFQKMHQRLGELDWVTSSESEQDHVTGEAVGDVGSDLPRISKGT